MKNLLRFALISCFLSSFAFGANSSETSIDTFVLVPMEGTIHGGTVEVVKLAIAEAKQQHAGILIQLDTPGGLLEATRELVKLFLNSPVPIVVLVGPSGSRAGSAGTFITIAAHVAVMAPGTNIGAAHPITISGKDPEQEGGKHLAQKIENDTLAFIETIANQRGKNVEWARKAVKESSSITEEEALKLGVIDFIADSPKQVLAKLGGKDIQISDKLAVTVATNATLETLELPFELEVLNKLASPTIMFALLVLVALGLYIEFSQPGLIFPSVVAVIAAVVLLFASRSLPMSYLGVVLIMAGAAMLVAEIYITSFGLLTVGGIAAFFVGGMMLFDPAQTDIQVPISHLISTTATFAIIAIFIGYMIAKTFSQPIVSGKEMLIGRLAKVVDDTSSSQEFKVFIDGETWNAVSDRPLSVSKNSNVKIVGVSGLLLKVEQDPEKNA